MPYLGNEPGAITDAFTQTFTGDGSTTNFTLSQSSTTNAVFVRISGVMQRNGTDFTVSGTTLTFTTAPPAASNNIVVQFFTVGSIQTIADDAVATAKIADNAVTLAKLAGGTDGNLITFDASGDPAFVATGSSGQLLTSAGAGAPPTFTTVSSGGLTLIQSITSSGASTADFENSSIFDGTYHKIIFELSGVDTSANGADFRMQFSTGGSYQTGNDYSFHLIQCTSTTNGFLNGLSETNGNIRLLHQVGNDSTESGDITIEFGGPLNGTAFYKMCKITASSSGTGTDLVNNIVGSGMFHGSAAALDGIRFSADSGTFSMTGRCYGVTKS